MDLISVSLLQSLLLTLIAELFLAAALKVHSGKDLVVIALVNCLTNPIVNYCYYWAVYWFSARNVYTFLILLGLEAFAVITEFLLYKHLLSYERIAPLKLSLLLNGASFLLGLLLNILLKAI